MECTIFHPSGFGQGSDTGSITSCDDDDFKFKFAVQDVRQDDNGIVYHYGVIEQLELKLKLEVVVPEDGFDVKGKKVIFEVSEARRKLNSRLHSAGHLMDACIAARWLQRHRQSTKGYHPSKVPYVEYEGTIPETEMNSKLKEIETEANALISRGGTGSTSCFVKLGTLPGFHCCGTHVSDVSEISSLEGGGITLDGGLGGYNVLELDCEDDCSDHENANK